MAFVASSTTRVSPAAKMLALMCFLDLTYNLFNIFSSLAIGHTLCICEEAVLVPLVASTVLPYCGAFVAELGSARTPRWGQRVQYSHAENSTYVI